MGPKEARSTVLSPEEVIVVAFRRHTLLPLDDCLYALQPSLPHLTRSSLHRCLQRHGISRLPEVDGDKPKRSRFKAYPISYFHIDIAQVSTEQGKLHLFVAIDRTSKFAFVQLHDQAIQRIAADFLRDLVVAVPYTIHTLSASIFTCPVIAWMLRVFSAAICISAAISEATFSIVAISWVGARELTLGCTKKAMTCPRAKCLWMYTAGI